MVADFDLAATLECGQAFRWTRGPDGWYTGVVGHAVWRLRQTGNAVAWEASGSANHKSQIPIRKYLSLDRSLAGIVATFPPDPALVAAVQAHRGLRVLRQERWETLASFIASSTKQIVQIRQIVGHLAARFGQPLPAGQHAFPSVEAIARATPEQLLACKLGFRAKHLLAAARLIDSGKVRLGELHRLECARAREELLKIPGVGGKIADCVLLFGAGFDQAFPVDVWIERALRRLYFAGQQPAARAVRELASTHFGPHAGWAQQYLFYDERRRGRRPGRGDNGGPELRTPNIEH